MSFLFNALGGAAKNLLGRATGFLWNKAKPIASKIGSVFSNAFGTAKNVLGNNAMEHLYNKGVNAAMGGIHKFANSDLLQRKVPMLAPMIGNAAQALKSRLDNGFANMMQGGTPGSAPAYNGTDGVEKMQM